MNTKKKAIFGSIAAIIVVAVLVLIICLFQEAEAEGKESVAESNSTYTYDFGTSTLNDVEFPPQIYKDEGYDNLAEWWSALKEKRNSFEGTTNDVMAELGDYITEEQVVLLQDYEKKIVRASNFTKLQEYEELFNAIVEEVTMIKVEAENQITQQEIMSSNQGYQEYVAAVNSGNYSGSYYDFLRAGIVNANGNKYTYYSQSVLPGGGLNIPGRHVDGGFVKDADGYIVLANDDPNGTVIDTPWGPGKVYDKGTSGNHYDVYVE